MTKGTPMRRTSGISISACSSARRLSLAAKFPGRIMRALAAAGADVAPHGRRRHGTHGGGGMEPATTDGAASLIDGRVEPEERC
jgi:hypothetical protein